MAGSFALCGIALLISAGLKPLLSLERGFLRPLAKQEVLWEAGPAGEGPGLANGGVGPVKEDRQWAEASQTSTCFRISCPHWESGVPQSPWVAGSLGGRRHHYSQQETVRYCLLSLTFCLGLQGSKLGYQRICSPSL